MSCDDVMKKTFSVVDDTGCVYPVSTNIDGEETFVIPSTKISSKKCNALVDNEGLFVKLPSKNVFKRKFVAAVVPFTGTGALFTVSENVVCDGCENVLGLALSVSVPVVTFNSTLPGWFELQRSVDGSVFETVGVWSYSSSDTKFSLNRAGWDYDLVSCVSLSRVVVFRLNATTLGNFSVLGSFEGHVIVEKDVLL